MPETRPDIWHGICSSQFTAGSLHKTGKKQMEHSILPSSVFVRIFGIVLCSFVASSCAVATGGNPEIFQIGEVEIRLYQDRQKMVQDLPPVLSLLEALKIGGRQTRVLGYYDRQNKRIYSMNDARVLIHEFKHYLEPDWKHGIADNYLEVLR